MPVDTNIDNYTIGELLNILGIATVDDTAEIVDKTNHYIKQYNTENNNPMSVFFQEMQTELLDYASNLDSSAEPVSLSNSKLQTTNWFENEILKQSNTEQSNKITERKQKIDVYDAPHLPMNQEQLGVSNVFTVPVAQDVLNPTLKNTTTRIICIDSQFRQSSSSQETSTDYTLDLSEPLLNVLILKLYSFAIPYTWYNVDTAYGNCCFFITIIDPSLNKHIVPIKIESGNYSTTTVITAINARILAEGITSTLTPVSINPINGKITINLYNAIYNSYPITETTVITFFDPTGDLNCNGSCTQTLAINQTLGWNLGFRVPYVNIISTGNIATAIPDFYGPKYFILVIDDFNQNHINNGLIGITEISKNVKMPSYYSPDLPTSCIQPLLNLRSNIESVLNEEDAGILLMDKLNIIYSPIVQVLPTAPRTLTQSQIYAINEIMKNNAKTTDYKLKAPVVSDTFAIIPIKLGSMVLGDVNVEFAGSLQDHKRLYFGPVNISRLRIKLLDDKGNVVNLNGCDWTFTIISENLYQY